MENSKPSRKFILNEKKRYYTGSKKTLIIPPTTLYTKSFGCAGAKELATVNMCVIFLLFSPSLLLAAPIDPKKRPYELKRAA